MWSWSNRKTGIFKIIELDPSWFYLHQSYLNENYTSNALNGNAVANFGKLPTIFLKTVSHCKIFYVWNL